MAKVHGLTRTEDRMDTTIDTRVTLVQGVSLPHPITNGPGWACKTIEDLAVLLKTPVSMPVIGSITRDGTDGNPEPRCQSWPNFSINAIGLENRGLFYYNDALPQIVQMTREKGLALCASVSESTPEKFLEVIELFVKSGVNLSELNFACPNVLGKEGILCFDFKAMELMVTAVKTLTPDFSVKVSPYSDPVQRKEAAFLFKEMGVPVVTLCNTFPDVLELNDNLQPTLNPKIKGIGLGGYGGPAMRPIVQAHVFLFRKILHPWQKIIAIGGVESGLDVAKYRSLGADVVQMTTAHLKYGPKVFQRVYEEYIHHLLGQQEA